MKKRKRIAKRAAVILLAGLVAAFAGVVMGDKAALEAYFSSSEPAFRIPDIGKGFIPQGIAYDPETDCFFLTGYMGNGKKSPIYAIERSGAQPVAKIEMLTEKGEKFNGHAGGLSVFGGNVYVAGSTDACMYGFSVRSVLEAGDGASLQAGERIDLKTDADAIRVSFTSVDGSFLYAGEFHKGLIFNTQDSHTVAEEGSTQKAYLFGFTPEADGSVTPGCVFSIPDSIQGACFADGYVYLSRSRGILPGSVLSYRLDTLRPSGTREVLGKEVPLYILTPENAVKVTTVPPMCEEMLVVEGKLYIVSEAAANRYIIGKPLGLDRVYATPVGYFQEL